MSQLAIDESTLLSERRIGALLRWAQKNPGIPGAVFPFLASMAGAALLPGEATRLRVHDVTLPEKGFGEVRVRAGESRSVPLTPEIVGVLRQWIDQAGLKPGDLLFPGERGGPLPSSVYRKAWKQACEAVLSREEREAGVGERVAILRESCLDLWLKAGVPVWVVAEWAGLSASWFAQRYPHRFRVEDVELDWEHLAKVTALPDSLNR
ncbi:tyrosine-type recombinase/integrase [Streptomyces lavenduligriseus]|uniref:Site-specific integrase n=1 Tax=Streptomyces lavenduligriseus TaxID=67315 RepID=A0ABT0NTF6_9ACTN|nr:tyrosine-type recombinase/integrase [Streptomyces lavenduligriseus]MCL3994760.1 site-specific integrase [Streptomyces lavenduligriseus]